jgi:hypothetical protein
VLPVLTPKALKKRRLICYWRIYEPLSSRLLSFENLYKYRFLSSEWVAQLDCVYAQLAGSCMDHWFIDISATLYVYTEALYWYRWI